MFHKVTSGVVCIFAFMLSAAVIGFAADNLTINTLPAEIDSSGVITINGNIDGKKTEENVTLTVYKEGNSYNGFISSDNQAEYVSAFTDTYTDNEGNFVFRFKINGEQKSGFYTARIGADCIDEPAELTFLYSNIKRRKAAVEELNKKSDSDAVYEYVFSEGNWADLGFYTELQSQLDKHNLSELIYAHIEEKGAFTADNAAEEYGYIEIIDALNEGVIGNIYDYTSRLRFSDTDIINWFKNSCGTSDMQTHVTKSLTNKGYKNESAFEAAFKEAVILEITAKPDGVGTVRDIITRYAGDIGINVSGATLDDFRKLIGSYRSCSELKAKFESIIKSKNQTVASAAGTGSSGGSGKGMSGIGSTTVSTASVTVPQTIENKNSGFEDLDKAEWAREAITALADSGIVNGRSEKEFAPNDNITREEFVKLIIEAFNIEKTDESAGFNDVVNGEWYEVYVNSAYKYGVVKGISEEIFGTGKNISRQDMAVMAYNAAKLKELKIEAVREKIIFNDDVQIADYAKNAVEALQTAGIINGMGDNNFAPNGNATRAEAVKMIYELIAVMERNEVI